MAWEVAVKEYTRVSNGSKELLNDANVSVSDANVSVNDANVSMNDINVPVNDANVSVDDSDVFVDEADVSKWSVLVTCTELNKEWYVSSQKFTCKRAS